MATSNKMRALNRLPYDFEDGLKVKGIDIDSLISTNVTQQLSNKQDTLISGTNIKTINGTSLLGSGDISVSGGTVTPTVPWAIYNSDSSANLADGTFTEIEGWWFTTGSSDLVSSYGGGGTDFQVPPGGTYFQVPPGVWYISVSIGVTVQPGAYCYVKFTHPASGVKASEILTIGSVHNPTASAMDGIVAGSGIFVSYSNTVLTRCGIDTSGGDVSLNPFNLAHRISIHKLEADVPI